MPGKQVDYEAMIAVYHRINKQRELTPEEQERLDYLVKRLKDREREDRYRSKNREILLEKKKAHQKTEAGRAAYLRANKKYYNKTRLARIAKAAEWRKNNPELYAAQNEKKRLQRLERLKERKASQMVETVTKQSACESPPPC